MLIFLLWNSLEFKYEEKYPINTATKEKSQYKPDFTIVQFQNNKGDILNYQEVNKLYKKLKEANKFITEKEFLKKEKIIKIKLYLEHFGIDKKGNVPKWFAKEGEDYFQVNRNYKEGIKWKRKTHKKYKSILIETFSYENSEDSLFRKLEKKLKEKGFILKKRKPEEMWQLIKKEFDNHYKDLLNLFETFLNLMKSKGKTIEELEKKFKSRRNASFLKVFSPIYQNYEKHLKQNREIDFNDMINKATDYIRQDRYQKQYKYIIIDEYQDIFFGGFHLMKALQDRSLACKTFVVGDDWQSIYRFAGSDIGLFTDFSEYFGETAKLKIETSYRYGEPLIHLSSKFIMKNPNQIKKEIKSFSNKKTDYLIYNLKEEEYNDTLACILDKWLEKENISKKKIALLGRYNFDPNKFLNKDNQNDHFKLKNNREGLIYYSHKNKKSLELSCITAHQSKGLEYDIVILINTEAGEYGFPSQIADDPVFKYAFKSS